MFSLWLIENIMVKATNRSMVMSTPHGLRAVRRNTTVWALLLAGVMIRSPYGAVPTFAFQPSLASRATTTRATTTSSGFFRRDTKPSNSNHVTRRGSSERTTTTCLTATALNPSLLFFSGIASPLGSLAVLAGVVLIHEAGHYMAARTLGIRVEEFSVGVGPKLVGFQAFGDDFTLRALPLGGYVRFPENYNATQVYELQDAAMKQQARQQEQARENSSDGTKGSLLSGLMNVATFGGYERRRRQIKMEQERQAAQVATEKPWWNMRLGSNNQKEQPEPPKDFQVEYYDDPDLLQNRPWPQRALVLSGGVAFNLLLAFAIFFGEIRNGSGLPQPVFEQGAVVTSIPRPDAASKGILKPGDVIVRVNGTPLSISESPNAAIAQRAISEFISTIRATPEGESLNLSILRDSSKKPLDLEVMPKNVVDESGKVGPQSIGAMLRPNFVRTTFIRSDSFVEATKLAASGVAELTSETASGLLAFFSSLGNSGGSSQSVSGPVGLIRQGSQVVATSDVTAVLTFAAALSVNLAVVNSLPLPALDGGQLVFVLAEAVSGRKIDQRLQEGITSVAILFLLFVTVGTTVGDIESLFKGR